MKDIHFPELHTERLVLRQLKATDDQAIYGMHTNDAVRKYTQRPLPRGLADAREFIRKINTGIRNHEWFYWAITIKDEDRLIGTICLWNFSPNQHKAETGFELHPDFQRKGIMQEALANVLHFGFQKLGLTSIVACTHERNKRSIHLLKRNGFVHTKTVSDNNTLTGNPVNMAVFELVCPTVLLVQEDEQKRTV